MQQLPDLFPVEGIVDPQPVTPDLPDLYPPGMEPLRPDARVKQARLLKPDTAVRDIQLSRDTGLDPELISRNRDDVLLKADVEKMNAGLVGAPGLRAYIHQSPHKMAAVADDVDTLAEIERVVQKGISTLGTTGNAVLRFGPTIGQFTYDTLGLLAGTLDSAARDVEDLTGLQAGGLFGNVRDFALSSSKEIQDYKDEYLNLPEELRGRLIDNPQYLLDPQWLIQNVGDAAASLAPVIMSATLSGSNLLGGLVGGLMEGASQYRDLIEEGVDPDSAALASQAMVPVVAVLNKLGLDAILSKRLASTWLQRAGKFFVAGTTEAATEYAEEPFGALFSSLARGDDYDTTVQNVWKSFENIDVIPGAFLLGGGVNVMHTAREQAIAQRADQEQQVLDALTQNIMQTKLGQLDPMLLEEVVGTIKAGGQIENVYVPASAMASNFGQDLQGMGETLNQLGVSMEQFDAALATGNDLVIPVEKYAAVVAANQEFAARFANDRRLTADGLTRNEAVQAQQDFQAETARLVQMLKEDRAASNEYETQIKAIQEEVLTMRQETGLATEAARADARMTAATFGVLARMNNVTPQELWQTYGPQVQRGGQNVVDLQTLQQDAAYAGVENEAEVEEAGRLWAEMGTESPYFKRWSGGAPVVRRGQDHDFQTGQAVVVEGLHGTDRVFDAFDANAESRSAFDEAGNIFFTTSAEEASVYAEGIFSEKTPDGANIIPAFIRFNNPMIEKVYGDTDPTLEFDSNTYWAESAKYGGYDGLIVRNSDTGEALFVAFDPTQIKSVNNRGTFDPADARILYQVPPDVARSLNYETKLPQDPIFKEAVANTPGAELLADGVELDLTRYQKEEQTGDTSVRTGVFYLPTGSAQEKYYRGGKNAYGGTVKIQGRTLLRAPLFVKGATGGKAPEAAYDSIMGKKAYANMRDEVLSAINGWGLKDQAKVDNIRALLDKYEANTVDAYEIYNNSRQGNTLAYAIQENIVAHAVRRAGYDSVVGYSKKKDGGAFISEVFDVREMTNPDESGYSDINDTFYQSLSTRLPSAVKATEDPLNEVLTLDFNVALSDTKTLEKNMLALLATPNMRKPKGKGAKTPAKQAELFIDHVVSNLLFLHDAMDPDMRARAKLWYDGGRKTIETWAERYGISEMQGAALIAVLSPQNGWFPNVSQAERIADIVFGMRDFRWDDAMSATAEEILKKDTSPDTMAAAEGKTLEEVLHLPDVAARWIRVYDQTHNSRAYRVLTPEGGAADFAKTNSGTDATNAWKSYGTIAKAVSILLDGRAENVYYQIGQEHKVRNFYNNLFDPASPLGFTTIDTHAVAAAMLRPLAAADTEVLQAFGGTGSASSAVTGMNGTYPLYLEAFKRAAEARGLLPREMQSITWEAVRGLFEASQKRGLKVAANAIWERYKAGEIEQEQAQQEIFELAGGVTPPSWSQVPFTDEVQRTYTGPAQERIDARGPAGKTDSDGFRVFFEVAPDPNDAALTAEWDALPQDAKQAISQQVAQTMVPKVLTEIGASGAFDTQLGGYLGATNPSLALILDQPELLTSAAKLLGYVLSQDGMMVVSDRQSVGTQPVGAVTIDLPEGYGAKEVEALYDKLWELEHEGEKLVGGHTTANGHMVILNFSNLDTKGLADVIYEHLGGEFNVDDTEVFSAFIDKEAYQYGRDTDQQQAAARRTSVQGRADNLRNEATRLLREALDARGTQTLFQLAPVRGGGPQILRAGDVGRVRANYGEQAPGGRSVVGIHYSSEPRESLSGHFYGTGIKGAEAKRLDLSDDPRLKKRIHFYVDRGQGIRPEPGVGANIHAVNLNNLYDISEDPLGLKAAAYADKMVDPSVAFNNLESAIIDAGFDGILVPNAQTNNGVAVLLGDKHVNVPVDLVQPPRGGQAAQAAPAVPSVSARVIQEPDGSQRIMYTDNDTARIAGSATVRDGVLESTEIRPAFEGKGFEQAIAQDLQGRGVDTGALYQQRGEPQAAFTFKTKSGKPLIELFQTANQSSFLHETGHLYLEMIRDLAIKADAPPAMQDLWLQAKTALKIDDGPISREAHEEWARNLEAYFAKGEAPSLGMRGLFAKYAEWLKAIYREVENIFAASGTQFNADLKPIFDRLFATEQETREAEAFYAAQKPFFDLADQMTDEDRAALQRLRDKAQESSFDTRLRRLTEAYVKAQGGRKALTDELRPEVEGRRVYTAIESARAGGFELAEIDDLVGEDTRRAISKKWRLAKVGGDLDPNVVAAQNGYDSAREMLMEMASAPNKQQALKVAVDERVEAERQKILRGLLDQDAVIAADEAYHNEDRLALLVAEFTILAEQSSRRQGARARALDAAAALEVAKQTLRSMPLRDAVKYQKFARAEREAAIRSREAKRAGKTADALQTKRTELLNHALFMESMKLRGQIQKLEKAIKKGAKQKSMLPAAKDLLQGLGVQYGLMPYAKLKKEQAWTAYTQSFAAKDEERPTLAEWASERENEFGVYFDPFVLQNAGYVPLQDLTVEQFDAVRQAVNTIRTVDRNERTVLVNGERIALEEAEDRLEQSILGRKLTSTQRSKRKSKLRKMISGTHAFHAKMEAMILDLDNWSHGHWWNMFFKPIADAENARSERLKDVHDTIQNIFKPVKKGLGKRVFIPEINDSLQKAEILAIALNMGNEGNILRLRQGFKDWDLDALFQRMTQTEELMTAKDWKFVQDVWDYLDSFRPESFKLQKDLTGREPERIMPTPLTTMHGVLKGGYYPAAYDTDLNYTAFTREQKDLDKQLFGGRNYGAAMTKHSHLKERATTGAEQALSLDLGVITDHLYNTVHDLTHRKAVVEVAKMMRRPKVRKMVEDALSPEAYREFMPWLQDVAQERQEPMNQLHRAARWARKGTTIMQMGLKFTTMITQPLGILQTLDVIGPKWAAVGLKHVYGNSYRIHKVYEEITTKSTFMNNRIKSFDREVRDAMKGLTAADSFMQGVQEFAFKGIGYMQLGVDMPTWWGAYQRGLSDNLGDEAKAVAYADSAVRISQGSGATKDLARVQRGGEFQRLATMFYSYFSALYSLTYRRVSKTKSLSDIPTAAGSAIALWFLPAILSELIAGRGPDDDEEWPEWMAGLIATYPFLMFVGVKDIASAIESGFDYQMTPAASAPGALVKWARQVYKAVEEEDPERAVKPTIEAVGYALQLPLKQPVITLGNIWDYMTGEDPEFEVRDLFFVKPKSRR